MQTPRFGFRALIFALPLIWGFSGATAAAQDSSQGSEVEQLRKRVADQERRIAWLEQQVTALMAAAKDAAPPAKQEDAAAPAPAAATAVAASSGPASTSQTSSRELQVAGVKVGGDVYLFEYVPYDIPGARPKFELYAFSVKLQGQKGPWEFYSDYRFRTTKLRSFFPGNTWLQQGYVGYRTSFGEIKAGSFYRRVGIFWDDSFFGNIQYYDGFKLDPELGVGFEGARKIAGKLGAEYSVQYFSSDARVNGSLPGRDFLSQPNARAKNDVTLRLALVWHFKDDLSLTVGGSYAKGTIERDGGPHNSRRQYAGEVTMQWKGLLTYAEVLQQDVSGVVLLPPQNATYTLIGARWARGRFQPHLNYSNGNYHGLNPRREYIIQPGITVNLADGFSFIYEYDYWKQTSVPTPSLIDKSLDFVLLYHF